MTNFEINNIYTVTEKLSEKDQFSDSVLWCLFKLRKDLREHVDFYNERLKSIQDKYVSYADENGQIHGEVMDKYVNDVKELGLMDKDISNVAKYDISIKEFKGITVHDMESLEPFINFTNEWTNERKWL